MDIPSKFFLFAARVAWREGAFVRKHKMESTWRHGRLNIDRRDETRFCHDHRLAESKKKKKSSFCQDSGLSHECGLAVFKPTRRSTGSGGKLNEVYGIRSFFFAVSLSLFASPRGPSPKTKTTPCGDTEQRRMRTRPRLMKQQQGKKKKRIEFCVCVVSCQERTRTDAV